MKKDEIGQILVQMGFDMNEANMIMKSLLDQFISKGFTLEQALDAIAADLQSRGKLFHKLQASRQKKPEISEKPSALEVRELCPKCGYPKKAERGGESPKECANCGVIFEKLLPKDLKSPSTLGKASQPAQYSTLRQFASRHKVITIAVSVLLVLFFAGLAIQGFYKLQHKRLLTTFNEALKMDTKEEFETSLENLQYFIENTALLVARRGWSNKDLSGFYSDVNNSIQRFNERMETAASGESKLFGYDLQEVKNNLCAGEKIVILCIRDKKFQFIIMALSFKLAKCDAAQYKTSSKMVLIRDGQEYVLKHRKKSDSSGELNAKQDKQLGPTEGKQASVKSIRKAGNELQEARILLIRLQEDYRRRNKRWCNDDRELIAVSKANGHFVSPATEELVNNGRIATEIVNERIMIRYPRGME